MHSSSDHAAELVVRVVPQVMRAIAADVREARSDVEPIYIHLLGLLSKSDLSLGELAEAFLVRRPTVSKMISTLEARGWVLRRRAEEDRRVVRVGLTPEGRAVIGRAREYMVMRVAEALRPLRDDQCRKLSEGLEALGEAFAGGLPSGEPDS